jgi:hypothetical protein
MDASLQIARREWGNIRSSLELCSDIEEFNSENPISSRIAKIEDSRLVENLIRMENKLQTYGYFTQEASYVFTLFASIAAERLGLKGKLAKTYGRGYSWVRTGWFDVGSVEKHHLTKQIIFFKLFFPLGRDFIGWDFNSPAVKTKLKAIVDKFALWQSNPDSYVQDITECREQLEPLWYGLSSALDFPVTDSGKRY